MDTYHPASAPVADLEAPAPVPLVDRQTSTSGLETQAYFLFLARDMDSQAVLDQVVDLEAQASAQEAYLELPPLGLE